MATPRGGKPPNQAVLRMVRRRAVTCSRGLAEWSPLLLDAGYPGFALDFEKISWALEKTTDQMQARLEQP